jgi:hypothetical protein
MHSQGRNWQCPSCGKKKAKSGATHGGYRRGVQGGTDDAERMREYRKRTGRSGNEARERKKKENQE